MLSRETLANFLRGVVSSITSTSKRRAPTGGFPDEIWPETPKFQLGVDDPNGARRNEDGLWRDPQIRQRY